MYIYLNISPEMKGSRVFLLMILCNYTSVKSYRVRKKLAA